MVAGLSARMLAESARAGGYEVIALDLFGDRDTRRVAQRWYPLGEGGSMCIDERCLLDALGAVAREWHRGPGGVLGWIAGSGFEGRADLLAAGSRVLPLIGNSADCVARVRDPMFFFSRLSARGVPHPQTCFDPPEGEGWLQKDAWSSGGWQVFRHGARTSSDSRPGRYFQQELAGDALSVLFLADGRRARAIGYSRQLVRPFGARPFVFRGCLGPIDIDRGLALRMAGILDALTEEFGLRGLNGVDFLVAQGELAVLEVNPRPTASMAVYAGVLAKGLVHAHIEVCGGSALPDPQPHDGAMTGYEVVFARRACALRASAEAVQAELDWCHDRPRAGTRFAWGEPVCSVSAIAPDEQALRALLAQRRRSMRLLLEPDDE